MAYNTDTGWILEQAMFERATTEEEVKTHLIKCLEMLKASHDVRVMAILRSTKTEYAFRSVVRDKKYYCEIQRTVWQFDGVENLPFIQTYEYQSTQASSKPYITIDHRYTLKYSGTNWSVTLLEDSDIHDKGFTYSWSRKHSDVPNYTETFTPEDYEYDTTNPDDPNDSTDPEIDDPNG